MSASAQLSPVVQESARPLHECAQDAASGRHVFVVCSGDSCRHAGSNRLLGLLQRQWTQHHESHDIRISSSKCLGRCGTAPAMVENGRLLGWVSLRRLKSELLRLGLFPAAS